MENTKQAVDINEMIDVFELDQYIECSFIDTITGEVIPLTVEMEEEDEGIPDHYIALPDRYRSINSA